MVLIYKGTVDSLVQQVGKYKDRINERYQQVLGDENYKKLESIAQRVLVPESFFNTYEELQRFTRENIPIETPSKFMILTDSSLTVDESGKIKEKIDLTISIGTAGSISLVIQQLLPLTLKLLKNRNLNSNPKNLLRKFIQSLNLLMKLEI